ncbi:MAG: FAD binding domain-containing protein [Gemmobacter sp.]
MKASVSGYARAGSLAEALRLLAASGGEARVIAGGQSLTAAMNMGLTGEIGLIDIGGLDALRGIRVEGDRLVIGALTTHAALGADPLVARHAPLLAQAVPLIAHAAIRNRGTIGGSLAHADPAAELPACALALGARIHAEGPDGAREIAAEAFFLDVFTTALAADEILTAVSVPLAAVGERHAIRELARRSGDYALAGLAMVRRGAAHRLAFFGCGATPVLARAAMAALDAGDAAGAVAALADDLDPPSDTQASSAYRLHLARVLLTRLAAETREPADA